MTITDAAPQDRREHIPDPTVKTHMPATILAALGNAHANLQLELPHLLDVIDTLGWPEGNSRDRYEPLDDRELSTALDYARANAELTWVLCGLVNVITTAVGAFVRSDDGELISMGENSTPL